MKLTLKQVAEAVRTSPSHLSKIENGKYPPTVDLRKKTFAECGYSAENFKDLSQGGKSEGSMSVRN